MSTRVYWYRRSFLPPTSGVGVIFVVSLLGSQTDAPSTVTVFSDEDGNNNYIYSTTTREHIYRDVLISNTSNFFLVNNKVVSLPPVHAPFLMREALVKRFLSHRYQILSSVGRPTITFPSIDETYNTDFYLEYFSGLGISYRIQVFYKNGSYYLVIFSNQITEILYNENYSYYEEMLKSEFDIWPEFDFFYSVNGLGWIGSTGHFFANAYKITPSGSLVWEQPMHVSMNASGTTYTGIEEFGAKIGATTPNWLDWFLTSSWKSVLGARIVVGRAGTGRILPENPPWDDTQRENTAKEIAKLVGMSKGKILPHIPTASQLLPDNPHMKLFTGDGVILD